MRAATCAQPTPNGSPRACPRPRLEPVAALALSSSNAKPSFPWKTPRPHQNGVQRCIQPRQNTAFSRLFCTPGWPNNQILSITCPPPRPPVSNVRQFGVSPRRPLSAVKLHVRMCSRSWRPASIIPPPSSQCQNYNRMSNHDFRRNRGARISRVIARLTPSILC